MNLPRLPASVRAVFFDAVGTLIAPEPSAARAYQDSAVASLEQGVLSLTTTESVGQTPWANTNVAHMRNSRNGSWLFRHVDAHPGHPRIDPGRHSERPLALRRPDRIRCALPPARGAGSRETTVSRSAA
jgi:hypothetical protein